MLCSFTPARMSSCANGKAGKRHRGTEYSSKEHRNARITHGNSSAGAPASGKHGVHKQHLALLNAPWQLHIEQLQPNSQQ